MLSLPFMGDEVKQALAQMHSTKAPGLDVMSVVFFPKILGCCG